MKTGEVVSIVVIGAAATGAAPTRWQRLRGRIDAYEQRRPNSLCCVYGAALAPGATVAFDVVPSGGQSWYRLLAFLTGDDQAQVFGFTSLRVGGMDQIFSTQTLPTPAPVANASAWYGFVARGDNQVFNLAPWTGFTFSNDVHVTGTIVNMTIAATGDVSTGGAGGRCAGAGAARRAKDHGWCPPSPRCCKYHGAAVVISIPHRE